MAATGQFKDGAKPNSGGHFMKIKSIISGK